MARRLTILLALTLWCLPLLAQGYASPGSATGFVNDFAGVLPEAAKSELEQKLATLSSTTTTQVVVVTVSSLAGDTIENYAVKLFEEWGIGQKGKDNGALLLVAVEDREVRIEVGYGLEGSLTDAQSSWIIRNLIVPAFRTGDYAGGITAGTNSIVEALAGGEVPSDVSSSASQSGENSFWFDYFWLFFAIPMWLASILGRSKSWWAGGVIGGVAGLIIGAIYGFLFAGLSAIVGLGLLGLLFDYVVSKSYGKHKAGGHIPWWIGGGRGGTGGGFGGGGFGGGMSGGGGASGRW